MGRGQATVASDQFEAIFGNRRGASRPLPCGRVFDAYSALTQDDLDDCLKLAMLPDESVIFAGAKIDREVLDRLRQPASVFSLLAKQADTRAFEAIPVEAREVWTALARRLRDCVSACMERDDELRDAANARKMGMLSVEGDIAMSRLVDSLPGLSVRDATNAIKSGIQRLSAIYPGTGDTENREGVSKDLLRLGIRLEPIPIW